MQINLFTVKAFIGIDCANTLFHRGKSQMTQILLRALAGLIMLSSTHSKASTPMTIEEYNNQLPYWGVSWAPVSGHINGYHPSFYTGFAPRSQNTEHIHLRTSRGNQTRVSVILNDETLKDYLYDLKARYRFYKLVSSEAHGAKPIVKPISQSAPQLESFFQILESPAYSILDFLSKDFISEEELYTQALNTVSQLNPGRVFQIEIDLRQSFLEWQNQIITYDLNPSDKEDQIVLINALVWGRINYTDTPDPETIEVLQRAVDLAKASPAEPAFLTSALELLQRVAGNKYRFRIYKNNNWRTALDCADPVSGPCTLAYPEFTAIYPTGSLKSFTRDSYGNRIPQFATPGLWNFVDSGGRDDVDNIRSESYYGWAPKMDYEAIGNGFHNPAVRFHGVSSRFKKQLDIPKSHNTLWAVKRGGVSSGCLRLPLGHVWELRHIFPVQNELIKNVYFFGNTPKDFDLYDVNGDGQLQVMGVEYMISYDLQGANSLAKREGKDLEVETSDKLAFYSKLYGSKNVFEFSSENYVFTSPSVAFPSWMDYQRKGVQTHLTLLGTYPLYEQTYEKDKVQFYVPISKQGMSGGKHHSSLGKRIIRLMGRVRGCAPTSNKEACGEAQFQREAHTLYQEISRITGRQYE